jgi:RNA polymerase sigma-70 factor (ECF subfamily)
VSVAPQQLAELIDQHAAALVLLARTRCDCADDVVQEALIALATEEPPPDEPRAWLFSVVRRRAISAARAAARRRKYEASAAKAATAWFQSSIDSQLDAQMVTDRLANLGAAEREVVVLRLWSDLTFREIALVTELSSSTAQRTYEAAIEQLRKSLEKPCSTTKPLTR